jgi:hypothetical protein
MSGLNIHIHTILTFTIAIHTDRVHYADEEAFLHCRVILRELSVILRRHDLKVKNGGSLPEPASFVIIDNPGHRNIDVD